MKKKRPTTDAPWYTDDPWYRRGYTDAEGGLNAMLHMYRGSAAHLYAQGYLDAQDKADALLIATAPKEA